MGLSFWLKGTGVIAVALLAISLGVPHRELDWDGVVVPLAQRYAAASSSSTTPLQGTTILITGASDGLGLSLTRALSKLGGTVLALGRSPAKLERLRQEIPTVQTLEVDLTNLEAVSRLADQILNSSTIDRIDILINNAGMHAAFNLFGTDSNVGEDPAYDRVFVVNYLSHFLLTEKLAPLLSASPRPVVVQTSSSFHWAVDGSDLVPGTSATGDDDKDKSTSALPIAARPGGSHGFIAFRTQRSYSNSKLAQIFHARALKRNDPRFRDVRVVSFCPGWVATSIVRSNSWMTAFLDRLAFPADSWGIASALHAIFDNDNSSDWYINAESFLTPGFIFRKETPSWMNAVPLRDAVLNMLASLALLIQHLSADMIPTHSSPESYNQTKANALYIWSKNAIEKYL